MIDKTDRRSFLILNAKFFAIFGGLVSLWPLVDSFNPSKDVVAVSTKEVSLSSISKGNSVKVIWQGKPVFIRNRTDEEVSSARSADFAVMRHPEDDRDRTKPGKDNWLVLLGICTHLGCVPINQSDGSFYCPCHGSHYDTSGRIVSGPAPTNLVVPEYLFVDDHTILIGKPSDKGGEI